MKKNNALAVVGAVFLVLVGLWFATRDSAPKVGVKELRVAKIDKDSVTKIEVTIPGKESKKDDKAPDDGPVETTREPPKKVVLEKDGAGFVVYDADKSEKKFAVDDVLLKPLLEAVGEFATGDLVANKADKLAGFEIDDEKGLRVAVTTTKGKELELIFGRAAKGGGTTVRAQGSNDVFVGKGRLGTLAKKEVSGWRKKTLLDKKVDDFTSVTVARADGATLVVTAETKEEEVPVEMQGDAGTATEKKKTTAWKLTAPSALPPDFKLDESAVSRLPSSLVSLRAADFADDVTDDTAGFVAAHTTVTGKTTDGKDVVVHLGKKDEKSRVYLKIDGDKQVYLVADYTAKGLDRGIDDLRDLSLFSVKLEEVERATFQSGKTRVVVEKSGGTWTLVEPKVPPAEFDLAQVASVVGQAVRLRAARFAGGSPKPANPDVVVELATKDKRETVSFGKQLEASDASASREFAGVDAAGNVVVVNAYTRDRFATPEQLFKKPPSPPPGMGGMGGMGGLGGAGQGLSGLENLPPEVRKKLEESLKKQGS
jgi:hypothetical protein